VKPIIVLVFKVVLCHEHRIRQVKIVEYALTKDENDATGKPFALFEQKVSKF